MGTLEHKPDEALPTTDRRTFLSATAGAVAGVALGPAVATHATTAAGPQAYPFTLGIASGDPLPNSVILWTRLAVDPLNGGGMEDRLYEVSWEVATDEQMGVLVRHGVADVIPAWAHSVHVDVNGLEPGRDYFYRFRCGSHVSPIGRTRTAPAVGSQPNRFRFAYGSCQNYTAGYFTAHDHLATEDLDLMIWLGDYIYDTPGQPIPGRTHVPPYSVRTIDDFRLRHAQYKLEQPLQEAHRAHPWLITLDDHDIINDLSGFTVGGHPELTPAEVAQIRETAYHVAYEHLPMRQQPAGAYYRLYRGYDHGDLAHVSVLDNRQYSTPREEPCAVEDQDPSGYCPADLDPERATLGPEQTDWLLGRLGDSPARWNVIGNPAIFTQKDREPDPNQVRFNRDAVMERQRIIDFLIANDIQNLVLVTGDSHQNWVFSVPPHWDGPLDADPVATEFDGTSITSGGDRSGAEHYFDDPQNNPHQLFKNDSHGYTVCELGQDTMTAEFKVVSTVEAPTASLRSMCTWSVDRTTPGASLVSGNS